MGSSYYRLKQIDYDGAFEYSDIVNVELGIRNYELGIFPNPTNDFFTLQNISDGQVTIYNTLGQPLRSLQLTDDNTQISMTDLPSGQYFLEVLSADGTRFNELIIKN